LGFSSVETGGCGLPDLAGFHEHTERPGRLRRSLLSNPEHGVYSEFFMLRSLRESFLSNILNTKALVFYMAFLPLFIDPEGSALAQSMLLAFLHFVIGMIWQCLLVFLVERARLLLTAPRFKKWFDLLTGWVLFFGITLGLDG